MKLNRMSEEKKAPSWYANDSKQIEIPDDEFTRIASVKNLDDSNTVTEFEKIEKCAKTSSQYFYNSSWNQNKIKQLREYAIISKLSLDNFIGVSVNEINHEASSSQIIKTASTKDKENSDIVVSLKNALGDPFHIDERASMKHMEKSNWEKTSTQLVMKQNPDINGGVTPLRGGENYNTNSSPKTAPGNNSIHDPDAIKKLAESTVEDTGTRLKREKAEKEAAKITEHKNWEKEKIKAMEHNSIVSKGKVFPTESLVAQNGLNTPSSQRGVYSKFDPASIPDKTAGENIKDNNEARKKSIQRETAKDEWEKPQAQNSRGISDTFASELEKLLKKGK